MNEFNTRWLPVRTHRIKPRDGECVLIGHSTEKWVCGAMYHRRTDGVEEFESDGMILRPTHWMSLPDPPREYATDSSYIAHSDRT